MKQDLFIEASADAPRYFADQSGKGWIPIGCNLCFDRLYGTDGNGRNVSEKRFLSWMREFAANGGNFLRLWLGHLLRDVDGKLCDEAFVVDVDTLTTDCISKIV